MSPLTCKAEHDDDTLVIRSPGVGVWSNRPAIGALLRGGDSVGVLEVLGRQSRLVLPANAHGRVVGGVTDSRDRGVAVDFAAALLVLDPRIVGVDVAVAETAAQSESSGLAFCAPSSGRFWRRPSPGDPPLVSAGQQIVRGQPIGLLEVMKTFTRLAYDGDALPDRATVVRVIPEDGDDVEPGATILELEPA